MFPRLLAALNWRGVLLAIFPVFLFLCARSQTYLGLREIVNYAKQDYNAGAQNWDIRQDAQGRIYFANNEGLLTFDGIYWKLYPLPNKTIIRSIEFGKDNRIYIGAQDEIGYFSPDASGKLVYTSLLSLVPEADRKFADIWDLASFGDDVFFRSNNKILRYTKNKIMVYRPTTGYQFLGVSHDHLIVQEHGRGILTFQNEGLMPFVPYESLPAGFDIVHATSFDKDSSLITTRKNGLFVLSGNSIHPFRLSGLAIDPYQIFSKSIKTADDNFIVGSYTNGFYLVNKKGLVIENFSKKEGLQNSNVRSLFSDRNQNIWLGLDNGIDFIAFNNAIKHINPTAMNDGGGYAVAIHNNQFYFGLSNGLYQVPLPEIKDLSYTKNECRLIKEGQIWGLYVVNNKLLAGADDGFYEIKDNTPAAITRTNGFWNFQPLQNLHQTSMVAAGNYHGVRLYENKDNTFIDKGAIGNFVESARYLVIDNNNTIWVSHPYRGVYKIQLAADGSYDIKLYAAANGLPSALKNHVYKVKNRVVIATEKGIYEYNMRTDAFEPSHYFKEIFGVRGVRYLKEDPGGNIWFIQDKEIGVVDFSTITPTIIYMPELKGKMLSGFEHIFPINDNNIFVGGEKGFYHINFEKYKQNNHPLNVYIRSVKATSKNDSLLFGGYFGNVNEDKPQLEKIPTVSHKWNSFHIEYSSPLFEQQSTIEYSYFLEGFDKDWSEWSKKSEKDYTNLPARNYFFKVKARNNLHNESAPSSYYFTVLAPWYMTNLAYLFYILSAIYLGYYIYIRQRKKLLRERIKHKEEQQQLAYVHQLELEKSEKEVMKLRNEKLETEIEFKNTELASTAMHLVQKEEFLHKIKEELHHLNNNGREKADGVELKKILRILSEEEKLNEEWEQFSVHFDKVHGDFLVRLKEKYPSLKPHELKLCAYLRMNLSTKEIARLMSISVRGVEISRYRLRKKLEIPTETNLFQFLFDLQRHDFKT